MTHQRVIHVAAIRKAYGRTVAVDEVSFDVRPGEIFGLIGPNGEHRGLLHRADVTGRVLFVLVLLSHHRRRIVYVDIAEHPTRTGRLSKSSRRFLTTRRHAGC